MSANLNAQSNSKMARSIRFSRWCDQRRRLRGSDPTWRDVVGNYGVSRAQAYRWLAAWRAAGSERSEG